MQQQSSKYAKSEKAKKGRLKEKKQIFQEDLPMVMKRHKAARRAA